MPTQHGFRLEDTDDIPELICSLMSSPLEFSGQNSQGQFLNPAGSDGVIEFALQDGQLLTKIRISRSFSWSDNRLMLMKVNMVEKMCLRMNQPIRFCAPNVRDDPILPTITTGLELAVFLE